MGVWLGVCVCVGGADTWFLCQVTLRKHMFLTRMINNVPLSHKHVSHVQEREELQPWDLSAFLPRYLCYMNDDQAQK